MDREHRATAAKCESDRGKSPGDLSLPGWFKTAPSVARHSAHRRYHRPSIVLLKDFGDASMANDEHVALLDKGVATWNEWRDKNPDIRPDLSGANFFGEDLIGADLREADLARADLWFADLREAHLSCANLVEADLGGRGEENETMRERIVFSFFFSLSLSDRWVDA